jgi:hypothetical protein
MTLINGTPLHLFSLWRCTRRNLRPEMRRIDRISHFCGASSYSIERHSRPFCPGYAALGNELMNNTLCLDLAFG